MNDEFYHPYKEDFNYESNQSRGSRSNYQGSNQEPWNKAKGIMVRTTEELER